MAKPKNRVFCPECGKSKMLFETEKQALTFIKFNAEEIKQESGHAPCRAYFCTSCCGYHVTHNTGHTEGVMSVNRVVDAYKSVIGDKKEKNRSNNEALKQLQHAIELMRPYYDKSQLAPPDIIIEVRDLYDDYASNCTASKTKRRLRNMLNEVSGRPFLL